MTTTKAETVQRRRHCQAKAGSPQRRLWGLCPSLDGSATTSREAGERANPHSCQETLPRSQWLADRVVDVEVAGAYGRKASYRSAESDSFPLSVGGKKSREAGLQPQSPKVVTASPATAAKKHCQAHNRWQTALWALKWQVRTRGKQPIADQKATPARSASTEGRVVKPDCNHWPRNR